MTTDTIPEEIPPTPITSRVRRVATDRPWVWLALGWRDLQATRYIGLSYGAALAIVGWVLSLLLFELNTLWAILPATAGFFLLGPLVAAGLYETSRLRQEGQVPTLADAARGFQRNGTQIAYIGVALLVLHLFWVRMAGLTFMLFFGINGLPTVNELPFALLQSSQLLPFLIIGTGIGFVIACVSFAFAAVSIPMLVERTDISALEAVTVSIQVCLENWKPMALWAGLIVVLTGLALVPFFLGLLIVLPLIGHATWHAYRDLVIK